VWPSKDLYRIVSYNTSLIRLFCISNCDVKMLKVTHSHTFWASLKNLCQIFFFLFFCSSMFRETNKFPIRAKFHQRSTYSFYARRSQKRKKILTTWLTCTLLGTPRVKYACKYVGETDTRCNFHQHFTREFFVRKIIAQLFLVIFLFGIRILAKKSTFVTTMRAQNVDEIDSRCTATCVCYGEVNFVFFRFPILD